MIANLIFSILDQFGRSMADLPGVKQIYFLTFFVIFFGNYVIGYIYMRGYYEVYNWPSWISFFWGGFVLFRTSISISYTNIEANKKATKSDAEKIGSLMSNTLLIGIAVGGLSSALYSIKF